MRAIRARNTRPELRLRKSLHAAGLRYKLHDRSLPGAPDLVFPKYRAVVFVHGCFWHRHGCRYSKMPATRTAFWANKLALNELRDRQVHNELLGLGWRVGIVWECVLRGPSASAEQVTILVTTWLRGKGSELEVPDLP